MSSHSGPINPVWRCTGFRYCRRALQPLEKRRRAMAFTVLHFETDDYDSWKSMFDSDPAGRRQAGKGHIISRNPDNPREVFVRVEFGSVEDARSFRDRLVASGAL